MQQLFNKTFLKFTLGFLGILLVSFAFTLAIGYYGTNDTAPLSSGEGCIEGEC